MLADIDEARWGSSEAEADVPVDLIIATGGIDDGETVQFEIFRLYRERPEDAVATLDRTIDGSGTARAQWQPDSIEDPDDKYIFKAAVAGVWRKSGALTVVHQAASATWSSALAVVGDVLTLRTQIRGVKDGETAVFTVFKKFWHGLTDPDIDEIQTTVTDGVAEATWTIPEPEQPPERGDDGYQHLFFIAEAGGVLATSDLLTVGPGEPEAPSEPVAPSEREEPSETEEPSEPVAPSEPVEPSEPMEPSETEDEA